MLLFRAALGVKVCSRGNVSAVVGLIARSRIQSLTALYSECEKKSKKDNGSGAGLVSRARMPLKLSPRKKGITRIPPTLADTTSRPACRDLRRRTHGRRSKGLMPTTKYTATTTTKNKYTATTTTKNERSTRKPQRILAFHCITQHSARTRACFWREAPPFSPSLPQPPEEY
jgi:hypothetical protein